MKSSSVASNPVLDMHCTEVSSAKCVADWLSPRLSYVYIYMHTYVHVYINVCVYGLTGCVRTEQGLQSPVFTKWDVSRQRTSALWTFDQAEQMQSGKESVVP